MYEIKINKKSVFIKENTQPKAFKNLKVWAGNAWYYVSDTKIRNLIFKTNQESEETEKDWSAKYGNTHYIFNLILLFQ